MGFFARYTFPDDTSVDGDAIASNSGTLAWSNAVLARATPGTALAHLAAHYWDGRWDDLEHELGEFLHAVPDANVVAVTAAVLAAVKARPAEAAALLVTDGEPSGEEDDEGDVEARVSKPA
jgi:hypothetical protein